MFDWLQAGEAFATALVCVEILKQFWQARNLDALNAHILILCKRRAQLKHVRISAWWLMRRRGPRFHGIRRCCLPRRKRKS